ncbi:MAG TPA: hypothetical protein VMI54_26385 [Polyangiaceae bacterium]|nr:hypothetical protein [Polyangiaceae bacterium]
MTPLAALDRRRLVRWGGVAGLAVALFLAVGGFLHTRAGRPLLLLLAHGHCPFSRRSVDPKTRDALRHLGLSREAHVAADAPERPAFGFELGKVTRADVNEWANASALRCRVEAQGSGLACDGVSGRELAADDDERGAAYFRFDAGGRLVGVLRMQRTHDAERAVELGGAARGELARRLGVPTRSAGELSVASLARGPLRQARAEHRFSDFSATTSVTNLGPDGYLVVAEAELL